MITSVLMLIALLVVEAKATPKLKEANATLTQDPHKLLTRRQSTVIRKITTAFPESQVPSSSKIFTLSTLNQHTSKRPKIVTKTTTFQQTTLSFTEKSSSNKFNTNGTYSNMTTVGIAEQQGFKNFKRPKIKKRLDYERVKKQRKKQQNRRRQSTRSTRSDIKQGTTTRHTTANTFQYKKFTPNIQDTTQTVVFAKTWTKNAVKKQTPKEMLIPNTFPPRNKNQWTQSRLTTGTSLYPGEDDYNSSNKPARKPQLKPNLSAHDYDYQQSPGRKPGIMPPSIGINNRNPILNIKPNWKPNKPPTNDDYRDENMPSSINNNRNPIMNSMKPNTQPEEYDDSVGPPPSFGVNIRNPIKNPMNPTEEEYNNKQFFPPQIVNNKNPIKTPEKTTDESISNSDALNGKKFENASDDEEEEETSNKENPVSNNEEYEQENEELVTKKTATKATTKGVGKESKNTAPSLKIEENIPSAKVTSKSQVTIQTKPSISNVKKPVAEEVDDEEENNNNNNNEEEQTDEESEDTEEPIKKKAQAKDNIVTEMYIGVVPKVTSKLVTFPKNFDKNADDPDYKDKTVDLDQELVTKPYKVPLGNIFDPNFGKIP